LDEVSVNSIIRRFVLALVVVVLVVGASSAYADTILTYKISGPGPKGTFTASFTLAEHPTPSGGSRTVFYFAPFPVDVNGKWTNLAVVFSNALGGSVLGLNSFFLFGQQLFSWPLSSSTPIMNLGTYQLYGAAGGSLGLYTVTVTDPAPVPEPASFILLGTGVLMLLGVHLRRRFA
jgi:hypothetical protein